MCRLDDLRVEITSLANEVVHIEWDFSDTNDWLRDSDISEDKKKEIAQLMDLLKKKIDILSMG